MHATMKSDRSWGKAQPLDYNHSTYKGIACGKLAQSVLSTGTSLPRPDSAGILTPAEACTKTSDVKTQSPDDRWPNWKLEDALSAALRVAIDAVRRLELPRV